MEGETINQTTLVRSIGSQDATAVREVNWSNQYYIMLNKYGREVHINMDLLADKLKRGFIHTDGKIYSDDMSKRVHAPSPTSPLEAMAKVAEKMAESTDAMREMVAGGEGKSVASDDLSKKPFFTLKKMAKDAGMDIEGKTKVEILEFLNK